MKYLEEFNINEKHISKLGAFMVSSAAGTLIFLTVAGLLQKITTILKRKIQLQKLISEEPDEEKKKDLKRKYRRLLNEELDLKFKIRKANAKVKGEKAKLIKIPKEKREERIEKIRKMEDEIFLLKRQEKIIKNKTI